MEGFSGKDVKITKVDNLFCWIYLVQFCRENSAHSKSESEYIQNMTANTIKTTEHKHIYCSFILLFGSTNAANSVYALHCLSSVLLCLDSCQSSVYFLTP